MAIKNNVQHHVHPTPCGDAATIAKCPLARLACLKLPPGWMSNSRYLLQRESAPLLPLRGGKAKTIDRQFPYEMKINMTFLGLCTFVQQLVSLTRSSTRLDSAA